MSGHTQKLAVLRARTDRDVLILVQRELDRGFALVSVANVGASPLFVQAEKAYARAQSLLPRIAGLSAAERSALEARLEDLGSRLDRIVTSARAWSASVA